MENDSKTFNARSSFSTQKNCLFNSLNQVDLCSNGSTGSLESVSLFQTCQSSRSGLNISKYLKVGKNVFLCVLQTFFVQYMQRNAAIVMGTAQMDAYE